MTLNSVCTIDKICKNKLILEVLPNPMRRNELQFYCIDEGIKYISFCDFDHIIKENLSENGVLYITFCGISRENCDVPEYYYLTFFGEDVSYYGTEKKNRSCILEFEFKKKGNSIEKELRELMKDNIGVFIQSYTGGGSALPPLH